MSVIEMKRPDCPWCTTPVNPGEDSQGREPVDINGRLFHAGCIADMQRTGYDSATLEENCMAVPVRNRYGNRALARAAAGAALLDTLVPGWWRLVKIRPLDIGDRCNCVTGQLFGDYDAGLRELGLTEDEAEEYGFNRNDADSGSSFWTLTRAWKNEIRRRRDGAKVGRR